MPSVTENLNRVKARIHKTLTQCHRHSDAVTLLAVSKRQSAEQILACHQAGQLDFGENIVQEAVTKIDALKAYPLNWHFIGALQSNKLKTIAQHFSWVHSLSSLKHAARLDAFRDPQLPPLHVCIQVNLDDEAQKSGLPLDDVTAFLEALRPFKHLKCKGLMAIPKPQTTLALQRAPFHRLSQHFEALKRQGWDLDTLSMGMSNDLEAAIFEGATLVRVGTAIFGPRS